MYLTPDSNQKSTLITQNEALIVKKEESQADSKSPSQESDAFSAGRKRNSTTSEYPEIVQNFGVLTSFEMSKKMKPSEDSVNLTNGSMLGRSRPKSKRGCLTCKFRRKKCDETRPICKDCQRFDKECVWVDYNTMALDEIRKLKEKVKERESASKLRIRNKIPKDKNDGTVSFVAEPVNTSIKQEDSFQVRLEPLLPLKTVPTPFVTPSFDNFPTMNEPSTISSLIDNNKSLTDLLRSAFSHSAPGYALPNLHSPETVQTNLPGVTDLIQNIEPSLDEQTSLYDESSVKFLNFLREASLFTSASLDKLTLLDDGQQDADADAAKSPSNSLMHDMKHATGFNIYDFLEQVQPLSYDYPNQFLLLASTFNATFMTAPKPALSEVPELDAKGLFLYNYYLETLSKKVSIAPLSQNESNSYQRVFLPLAQKDKGVLYAILAWSGFHLGGKYMKEGAKYAEKAVSNLLRDVDFTQTARIEDRKAIVYKLATILILCGAEICRGDVKIWSVYLDWGWRLLRDNGGILNFDNNKEEHWLISNFAYHDLLAVSERPSYFNPDIYDQIFSDPNGNSKGNLNPLLGVSKGLYKVIGAINQFAYECKTPIRNYYKRGSPTALRSEQLSPTDSVSSEGSEKSHVSFHTAALACLQASFDKARELDQYIDNCRPEMSDLVNLTDRDLELQLTTFEAFQVSCKLHLRQSILKLNPSALECQILVHNLTKCIDILIGTPMQATLVFPIFIAGLYMVTEDDKQAMSRRFELMMKLYGPWNVVRAKYVVEKVWELNPDGDRWLDWGLILSELGWELNFA